MRLKVHIHVHVHKHKINRRMYACFIRVKLQTQSMVQNLDPKKKLEHRAQQNHEHHWFGRAWPAQCGSKRWPGRPLPQALNSGNALHCCRSPTALILLWGERQCRRPRFILRVSPRPVSGTLGFRRRVFAGNPHHRRGFPGPQTDRRKTS